MNNLITFYKNLLLTKRDYLRSIVKWFGISAVLGAVFFYFDQTLLDKIMEFFDERFGAEPALDLNLVRDLFLQNIYVSTIAIFGGVVLGIAPFFIGCTNGFILGYLIYSLFVYSDMNFTDSLMFIVAGLVPHAILELPAFIIAAGTGLSLGLKWLRQDSSGRRLQVLAGEFKDGLMILPLVGVMLFVAALVEVYVSGNLIK